MKRLLPFNIRLPAWGLLALVLGAGWADAETFNLSAEARSNDWIETATKPCGSVPPAALKLTGGGRAVFERAFFSRLAWSNPRNDFQNEYAEVRWKPQRPWFSSGQEFWNVFAPASPKRPYLVRVRHAPGGPEQRETLICVTALRK